MILYLYVLVQIIFESLPVSSSGHVALLERFLQKIGLFTDLSYTWVLDFLLHGPTIVILLFYFFHQWWNMIVKEPFSLLVFAKKSFWKSVIPVFLFVGIADGIPFLWWLQGAKIQLPLTVGFIMTAALLYSLRYADGLQECNWNIQHAIILGCAQALSLMPGLSRFATTYTVGSFLGYKSRVAFAVSFLIQIPLLMGAFIKGLIALSKNPEIMQNMFDFKLLFVILSASLLSYKMLSFVGTCIKSSNMWKFYRYMILPIVVSIIL